MSIEPIPPDVSAFLVAEVRSLVSLELLLLLYASRGRSWAVADLARELRSDADWTRLEVDRLTGRGWVAPDPKDSALARCAPLSPRAERTFEWLATWYPARRFSILQSLYSADPGTPSGAAPTQIQSFADAFKFQRDQNRG